MQSITLFAALFLASLGRGPSLQADDPVERIRPTGQAQRVHVMASRFCDIDGRMHQLGLAALAAPAVLVFFDPRSKDSAACLDEMKQLSLASRAHGIEFYGVLSNPALSAAQGRALRDQHGLEFPLLFDSSGELASRLQPTHQLEGFVLSMQDTVLYRGSIAEDPSSGAGGVLAAIEAVGQGRAPALSFAQPGGPSFEPWPADPAQLALSYNRSIEPIMRANCVSCHRTGDVAPFALDSYRKVKRRSQMILFACEERIMPPWQASPEVGIFREQRIVSDRQIELIRAWVNSKAPEGDAEDLLPPREEARQGWRLGEPDLILKLPAFDLPAEGADVFQNFVIPSGLTATRRVVAIEFRPKAKSVVHHMIIHVDDSGRARQMDEADPALGFSSYGPGVEPGQSGDKLTGVSFPMLRGWIPGQEPFVVPEGRGVPIKPGSDFLVATHYHLDGTAATDQTEIGLYFGDESVTRDVLLGTLVTTDIHIPAGEENYRRHMLSELPTEITFLSVTPHMHALGTSVDLWATPPGGERTQLLKISRWDYGWQNTYTFLKPITLPKGTLLESIHLFDNSSGNPDNPNQPPIDVNEGWYTFDEMCIMYFNMEVNGRGKDRVGISYTFESSLKLD